MSVAERQTHTKMWRKKHGRRLIIAYILQGMIFFVLILMIVLMVCGALYIKEHFANTFSFAGNIETDDGTRSELPNESQLSLIYQNPELPNGCEVTSLAMLLKWAGCPIDKVELAENYLPKEGFTYAGSDRLGPDPGHAYAGDPSSVEGWYCFESPIIYAGNTWLREKNSNFRIVSLVGLTQKELEDYLDLGIPLAVWVTLNYTPPKSSSLQWTLPDGTRYSPYVNLHCVVLASWSGDDYQIADPINGWQKVSPALFWSSFDAMGCRAVAVLPG